MYIYTYSMRMHCPAYLHTCMRAYTHHTRIHAYMLRLPSPSVRLLHAAFDNCVTSRVSSLA